jgi:hypothetical protein
MTRQRSLKDKVRARMQKTGERYTAARAALLGIAAGSPFPAGSIVVPGYTPEPGTERDLALLTAALRQSGVIDPGTGKPFTPTKVFGLSGGIGFMYFVFLYRGCPPMMTFTCRASSLPWEVVGAAIEHAGAAASVSTTTSAKTADRALRAALAAGCCAHLTVDGPSLPWSGADPMWRGHMPMQMNAIGTAGDEFVVDAGRPRRIAADVLAEARARARKDKHRLVTFTAGAASADPAAAVRAAVAHTAHRYREAPYKGFQANFGLQGLTKAARLMADGNDSKGWPKTFGTGPLAFLALMRTWECATREMTPHAGGRPQYAEFLAQAAALPKLGALQQAAQLARRSGEQFTRLADAARNAGGELLDRVVALTDEADELRRSGDDVGERLQELRREREAVGAACAMDARERQAAYESLAAPMTAIAKIETELVAALDSAVAESSARGARR